MSSSGNKINVRVAALAIAATFASACGGGGGSLSNTPTEQVPSEPPPVPDPTEPIVLIDSIPAAGVTLPAATDEFNVVHLGASDWQYEYDGGCAPAGVAVRRRLVELSDETPYPEVVDHKLRCDLTAGSDFELHVDTVAEDGTEHRASLAFTTDSNADTASLAVLESEEFTEDDVDAFYKRYVKDAALSELPDRVTSSLAASLITQIARDKWTQLGGTRALLGTVSERVSYPSRKADGSAAMLSGLVVRPRIVDETNFVKPERVVFFSHSTGSAPSDLDQEDAWYMFGNLLAARGYFVIAPDNWGNGETASDETPETYMMANRVATASLDMIDAVIGHDDYKSFFNEGETTDLALIGYSQGGHSGMAVWLAHAIQARDTRFREVYIGAGPYDLYRTLRGGLLRLAERCENSVWCDLDEQRLHYYVSHWTWPGYASYLDTGVNRADVLDDDRFTDEFVTGFLDNDPKYDNFKALLQLNSFTNLLDLTGTVQETDTHFHLFHAGEDRVLPRQNSVDMADTLSASFNVDLHNGECNGGLFDQLSNLDTGVVHAVCALEMFNRVLKDLTPVRQPEAESADLDAGAPWRALSEQHAHQALADHAGTSDMVDRLSPSQVDAMAAHLEALDTPAASALAARLRDPSSDVPDEVFGD